MPNVAYLQHILSSSRMKNLFFFALGQPIRLRGCGKWYVSTGAYISITRSPEVMGGTRTCARWQDSALEILYFFSKSQVKYRGRG